MLGGGDRDQGQIMDLHWLAFVKHLPGNGNNDWGGVAAHYCLGWHIPHPDHGDTGQSPAVGL